MTLAGKTAVVTGGSRGVGRAIVRRLAADGARVVFSYSQDMAAADALAGEIGDITPELFDTGQNIRATGGLIP